MGHNGGKRTIGRRSLSAVAGAFGVIAVAAYAIVGWQGEVAAAPPAGGYTGTTSGGTYDVSFTVEGSTVVNYTSYVTFGCSPYVLTVGFDSAAIAADGSFAVSFDADPDPGWTFLVEVSGQIDDSGNAAGSQQVSTNFCGSSNVTPWSASLTDPAPTTTTTSTSTTTTTTTLPTTTTSTTTTTLPTTTTSTTTTTLPTTTTSTTTTTLPTTTTSTTTTLPTTTTTLPTTTTSTTTLPTTTTSTTTTLPTTTTTEPTTTTTEPTTTTTEPTTTTTEPTTTTTEPTTATSEPAPPTTEPEPTTTVGDDSTTTTEPAPTTTAEDDTTTTEPAPSTTVGDDPTTTAPPAGDDVVVTISDASASAGQTVTISASGYAAGEQVAATLYSTPRELGTYVADDDGDVTFQFTIRADDEPGSHRVELVGETTGVASVGLTIAAAESGDDLPATGLSTLPLITAAAGLLAAGSSLAAISRRRADR